MSGKITEIPKKINYPISLTWGNIKKSDKLRFVSQDKIHIGTGTYYNDLWQYTTVKIDTKTEDTAIWRVNHDQIIEILSKEFHPEYFI